MQLRAKMPSPTLKWSRPNFTLNTDSGTSSRNVSARRVLQVIREEGCWVWFMVIGAVYARSDKCTAVASYCQRICAGRLFCQNVVLDTPWSR